MTDPLGYIVVERTTPLDPSAPETHAPLTVEDGVLRESESVAFLFESPLGAVQAIEATSRRRGAYAEFDLPAETACEVWEVEQFPVAPEQPG